MLRLRPEFMFFRDRDSILAKIETETETDTQNIGFTRPRPGLRPQSVTRLETDTETLLHNFGEIYKILILFPYSINFLRPRLILRLTFWKNRFRDWDWYLENSRDDAETESLVLWSHETWPMPRVSPTSGAYWLKVICIAEVITHFCYASNKAWNYCLQCILTNGSLPKKKRKEEEIPKKQRSFANCKIDAVHL